MNSQIVQNDSQNHSAQHSKIMIFIKNAVHPDILQNQMRRFAILSSVLFIFLIYYLTLYTTVAGGDSGELVVNAHQLGVAHPPGYPLFILLGKLFSFLPFGSIAWRVNLLSAFFDTLAALMLCLSVEKWCGNIGSGLFSAFFFSFSPLVWTYATEAEVFALNNFFACVLLYCATRYFTELDRKNLKPEEPDIFKMKWIYGFSFLLGLGLCNQHTLALFSFPMIVFIFYYEQKNILRIPILTNIFFCFLLGLLPYLYIPIASSKFEILSWGNGSTWEGFWTHVLRKEYGTFHLVSGDKNNTSLISNLVLYLSSLPKEFFYIGLLLPLLGAFSQSKTRAQKLIKILLINLFFFYILAFSGLSNLNIKTPQDLKVLERFWQLENIPLGALAGVGLNFLNRFKIKSLKTTLVGIILVIIQIIFNYQPQDKHNTTIIRDFGLSILNSLPTNAILLDNGDMISGTLSYLQQCEGIRPDIQIIKLGYLPFPWYRLIFQKYFKNLSLPPGVLSKPPVTDSLHYTFTQLVQKNYGIAKIFTTETFERKDKSFRENFENWPYGFTDQIISKNDPVNLDTYIEDTNRILNSFASTLDPHRTYPSGSWEGLIIEGFVRNMNRRDQKIIRGNDSPTP